MKISFTKNVSDKGLTCILCSKEELKNTCSVINLTHTDILDDSSVLIHNEKKIIFIEKENDPYKSGSKLASRLQTIKEENISCVTSFADEDLLKLSEACMLRYPKFEDYKNEKTIRFKNITFMSEDDKKCTVKFKAINMVCENVFYTRKLVNMPPNEMRPSNFVEECRQLEELGVKVTVLENDEIKDMGCLVAQ